MKIVFLDIDGVLNYEGCEIEHPLGHTGVDPEKVELLNQLLERTGAKVVISSTWRKHYTRKELTEYLESQGFRGEVIGFTPVHRGIRSFRGDEVGSWLSEHPEITHHVILDDDGDFHADQPLIQTDCMVGLTRENIDEAVRRLS